MRDYVQTQSCDSTINGNPVKGSVIRTFRFREFQDDPTDLNRVYLKAVKRDPGNAENPLGVPLAEDETAHPLWSQTTLCRFRTGVLKTVRMHAKRAMKARLPKHGKCRG